MSSYALTPCQERCFEAFKKGKSLVMTGPAGCGKSYLVRQMQQFTVENKKNIAVTALTGAAAALISGTTIHGWAGVGLAKGSSEEIYQGMRKFRKTHIQRWSELDILIIDEVSMMAADFLSKLHGLAQLIRRNGLFFGGIQVILCGDFCQLKPVSEGNVKFCFESALWQKYLANETYYLNQVMRQADPVFQELLANLRMGVLTPENKAILDQRIITDDKEADLYVDMPDGTRQTIVATTLYPKKKDVHLTNQQQLDRLIATGCRKNTYKCVDEVVDPRTKVSFSASESQIEVLNKCCTAPTEIVLTIGAQVMLIKNLYIEKGLVNGSRGVVTDFTAEGLPVVMFDNGESLELDWEVFSSESGKHTLTRKQVPLILAWALTIHKCQGATITNVITDLTGVFEEAQIYVTLSRACSLEGLFIRGINYSKIQCNPKVKAYYEALAQQCIN